MDFGDEPDRMLFLECWVSALSLYCQHDLFSFLGPLTSKNWTLCWECQSHSNSIFVVVVFNVKIYSKHACRHHNTQTLNLVFKGVIVHLHCGQTGKYKPVRSGYWISLHVLRRETVILPTTSPKRHVLSVVLKPCIGWTRGTWEFLVFLVSQDAFCSLILWSQKCDVCRKRKGGIVASWRVSDGFCSLCNSPVRAVLCGRRDGSEGRAGASLRPARGGCPGAGALHWGWA